MSELTTQLPERLNNTEETGLDAVLLIPLLRLIVEGGPVTVGEQPQQRDEQAGLSQSAEPLGQLHAEVRHRGFLQFVHAQHDRSDGSVVKALAAIRMPSAMVR